MPYFYHYTDDEAAKSIIRSGKILASVKSMVDGVVISSPTPYKLPGVAYGNGVYLTSLNPETSSKVQIAINNWTNARESTLTRVKKYFVINLRDSDVKDTNASGRNVHLYGRGSDLQLHKYTWWLRDFESGRILASYRYKVSSLGPSSEKHPSKMGDYSMTEDTVNGRPVYRCLDMFLFMNSKGRWMIGPDFGKNEGGLLQISDYSLGPDQGLPWKYCKNGNFTQDDATLSVTAFQKDYNDTERSNETENDDEELKMYKKMMKENTDDGIKLQKCENEIKELREKLACKDSEFVKKYENVMKQKTKDTVKLQKYESEIRDLREKLVSKDSEAFKINKLFSEFEALKVRMAEVVKVDEIKAENEIMKAKVAQNEAMKLKVTEKDERVKELLKNVITKLDRLDTERMELRKMLTEQESLKISE